MKRNGFAWSISLAWACCLTACGGGGGGGGNSGVSSTPPPPAPPPASGLTQGGPVKIFPGIDVSTQFATIGLEASRPGPSQTLTGDGFSVRYDAPAGVYVVDLPSTQAAGFHEYAGSTPNGTWWGGQLLDTSGSWQAGASVLKPSNPQLQLSYTTLLQYDTSGMSPEAFGAVAFGTPTSASAIPATGSASYTAFVAGSSVDNAYYIRGSASLQFNFGAGTLSGHLDPLIYDMGGGALGLGRYNFTNTVFSAGSTSFSGQLSNPSVPGTGSFNGIFTGPAAQELMARWQAPFVNPHSQQTSQMFGLWVGRR